MNPPIPSLYSVGGEFSQEANNCPLFVLPPAQSLHLLFFLLSILAPSIYFSSKQLNPIQETFRINCFFFLHQIWFVCVPHVNFLFARSIVLFVRQLIYLASTLFVFSLHTNIYIFSLEGGSSPVPGLSRSSIQGVPHSCLSQYYYYCQSHLPSVPLTISMTR